MLLSWPSFALGVAAGFLFANVLSIRSAIRDLSKPDRHGLPPQVMKGQYTAYMRNGGKPFVVFLIGTKVNSFWGVLKHARAISSFRPPSFIAAEGGAFDPDGGLLHEETYGNFLRAVNIQYWKSIEHLERWVRSSRSHSRMRVAYHKKLIETGVWGVWHETYVVSPGSYEVVYNSMPRFGLGAAGQLYPIDNTTHNVQTRLNSRLAHASEEAAREEEQREVQEEEAKKTT